MKKHFGVLTSVVLSLGFLFTLNHYLVPISYLSPELFAKVKPYLLPVGYYNQRTCSDLIHYLKGKKVAIVGPAASFEGSGYGDEIDAHDIIVRVNSAVWEDIEFKNHFGSRTDILVSSFYPPNLVLLNRFSNTWKDTRFVVAMLNFTGDFLDISLNSDELLRSIVDLVLKNRSEFCSLDDFFRNFESNTGLRANTGIATIVFLLNTKLDSLDIYGFDFYGSLYNRWQTKALHELYPTLNSNDLNSKSTKAAEAHDQYRHLKYFRNHIQNDKRVTFFEPREKT